MISAVVITKNEERNIKACLATLKWCDEVVVVDDDSVDETRQIAQKMGAKVLKRVLKGDFAAQRNFGLERAGEEWVLFIDADERVSEDLAEEIQKVIKNQEFTGYFVKRKDFMFGRWLKYGETSSIKLLRLARKDAGRWVRPIHERWDVTEKVGQLQTPLLHYPHPTMAEFLRKINFYTTVDAVEFFQKGVRVGFGEIILYPIGKFILNYFLKLGFLDGVAGLMITVMMSFHSFLTRGKIWMLQQHQNPQVPTYSHPKGGQIGWTNMKYLFFLLLVVFPFGQLGRLPFEDGELVIQLNDVVMGLLVGGWIFWHLIKRKKFTSPPFFKPIMAFSLLAIFSLLVNIPIWGVNLSAFLYLIRWFTYAGLYLFLYEAFQKKWISGEIIFRGMIWVGTAVGILGLFQYILYPDLRNFYYLGWDPHYFRVFSTFFDPAFTGIILVLTLILLVVSFWEKRPKGWMRWWFLLAVLVVYSAFILTYSRSSYLAFLAGAGAIAYLKRAPKFFLFTLLVFTLTLVVLPKMEDRIGSDLARQESTLARIINWKQSLQIIKDHPILGVGFNNYRQAQERYGFLKEEPWVSHSGAGADSSLLFVWATTGILGLAAYLWLGRRIVKLALRSWYAEKSIYGLALFASIAALFFHSLFVNSLFYPWIMEWVWILTAIVHVEKEKLD